MIFGIENLDDNLKWRINSILTQASIIPRKREIEFASSFSRRNEVSWHGRATLDSERMIEIEKIIFKGQDFTEYAYVSEYPYAPLQSDNWQLFSLVEQMVRFIDERNCQIAKLLVNEKEDLLVKVTLYLANEEYKVKGSVLWSTL